MKSSVEFVEADTWAKSSSQIGLLIMAAGYEERSLAFALNTHVIESSALVLAILYRDGPKQNSSAWKTLRAKFEEVRYETLELCVHEPNTFGDAVEAYFHAVDIPDGDIVIDISGMPILIACLVLHQVRYRWPFRNCVCLYCSADHYPPDDATLEKCLEKVENTPEQILPTTDEKAVAYEVIFPKQFSGDQDKLDNTCLFIFPGLNLQRSVSVCESLNPSRLVCVFGIPSPELSEKRLEYSAKIHSRLGENIERAERKIANTDVVELVKELEEFYNFLYPDHTIVLAPANSKLHALAAFLFWERFRDVQMVFPIPLSYNSSTGGSGIGKLYVAKLPPVPNAAILFAKS